MCQQGQRLFFVAIPLMICEFCENKITAIISIVHLHVLLYCPPTESDDVIRSYSVVHHLSLWSGKAMHIAWFPWRWYRYVEQLFVQYARFCLIFFAFIRCYRFHCLKKRGKYQENLFSCNGCLCNIAVCTHSVFSLQCLKECILKSSYTVKSCKHFFRGKTVQNNNLNCVFLH